MLSRIRSRLTYANVVATLSLFLVLSGGTAVALTGSNTVFSDDIVDNQVKSADVRNDTLAGGGLTAADLGPGSVGGSEVTNDSLTGADVKEPSLARVPQAGNAGTLDGRDSTHFGVGVMGGVMKDVGPTAVASGTEWAPIGASTATATGSFVAPAGGFVARDLRISLASPNGAGQTRQFAFLTDPPSSPTLSCTVPENASSCADATHRVTVSAGQAYSLVATAITGGAGNVDVRFGWRAVSPP
jgi:hypothetical protein